MTEPWPYVAFVLRWISSLVCIWVSVYFFRRQKGTWWLLIALAFALPLFGQLIINLAMGLPILPFETVYPELPSIYHRPFTTGSTRFTEVHVYWDFVGPFIAIALGWAYLDDKKTANENPPIERT